LISAFNKVLNIRIGPRETRIGVFGPYPKGGKKVIQSVAQVVSKLGYNAFTGNGVYRKNNPNDLIEINDILPAHVQKVRKRIPDRILFHEFPRLVSKAIFFENDERGQYEELRGCMEYEVPALGFIRHRKILSSKKCNFLLDRRIFSECGAPEPALCPHESNKSKFCPFYDSIDIPWFSKEILLAKENKNRLVAIRRIPSFLKVIKEFLSS